MTCADPAQQRRGRGPRPNALRALALAVALLAPAMASAQGTFPGQEPGRVGGVAPADGSIPAKAAAAAQNKQIAQELIDKQRDEAARLSMLEQRRQLREQLDRDASLLRQPLELLNRLFALPPELPLSADHRAMAESVLRQHRDRVLAAWPAWVTEESSQGQGKLVAETVSQHLANRVLNEAALWQADATPNSGDAVWLEALKGADLCRRLDQTLPAAQTAQLIEALPAAQRSAAWQGESERLARWGQKPRTTLQATERVLEDTLVASLPALAGNATGLAPALRDAVRTPGWTYASQPPAVRCELLRWWSQEQVRTKRLTPLQALHAWRTAMAVRSTEMLYSDVPRGGPQSVDKGGYPVAARRAGVTGKVVVEQDLDARGRVLRSFIQRREIQALGVRDVPALALERELDDVSLARALAAPAVAPDPSQLRDGTVTRRLAFEWTLQ